MAQYFSGVSRYYKADSALNYAQKTNENNRTDQTAAQTGLQPERKTVSYGNVLIPQKTEGYGMTIGEVSLSDKAKDYYAQLKSKFHGMDFILVSKDQKKQVEKNAAAYGNAFKPIVLIDDEKLEKMANDPSFRKKYEGIIAMAGKQLAKAKQEFASSGAKVQNFGIKVSDNGKMSFFATLEKSADQQAQGLKKRQEAKKQENKKQEAIKQKKELEKKAEKKAEEKHSEEIAEGKRSEKIAEGKRSEKIAEEKRSETVAAKNHNEKLAEESRAEKMDLITADSMEELVRKISRYAFDASFQNAATQEERNLGQSIDFRG